MEVDRLLAANPLNRGETVAQNKYHNIYPFICSIFVEANEYPLKNKFRIDNTGSEKPIERIKNERNLQRLQLRLSTSYLLLAT